MSFIIIYDNSKSANVLYASESVTEVLGWEPKELQEQKGAYTYIHEDDHLSLQRVHVANVMRQKMETMVSYRIRRKNGDVIHIETVTHSCHDVLVTSNFVCQPDSKKHKMRASSVKEVYRCMPDGSLQQEDDWLDQDDVTSQSWDIHAETSSREPRFYLILNRFTNQLTISVVSPLAQELVGLSEKDVGKSLFEFIAASDADMVQTRLEYAKENDTVERLRFGWQIEQREKTYVQQRVEAVVSCTDDGIVMVIRRSQPSSVPL